MYHEFNGSQLMISFIILLVIAFITAILAEKRGRNAIGWFILALLFSFLATLLLLILPSHKNSSDKNNSKFPPSPPPPPKINDAEYHEESQYLNKDRLWFYLDDEHNQFGPISIIGLRELWNNGNLKFNSYVWTEGMDKWETIDQLPDLHHILTNMKEIL